MRGLGDFPLGEPDPDIPRITDPCVCWLLRGLVQQCLLGLCFKRDKGTDIRPYTAVFSFLRFVVHLGPAEISRFFVSVESACQEGMAQAEGLHDTRLANAASREPADAS